MKYAMVVSPIGLMMGAINQDDPGMILNPRLIQVTSQGIVFVKLIGNPVDMSIGSENIVYGINSAELVGRYEEELLLSQFKNN